MSKQRYVSDTLKKRKKKHTKLVAGIVFIICLILLWGIVHVLRLPKFKIDNVQINGLVFIDEEEIRGKIDALLQKNTLWVIPHNNIFLFSKKDLVEEIQKNPAILSVVVNKKLFNSLYITIEEQEKQAVYCQDNSFETCFYVNPKGMIYTSVETFLVPEQEIIIYTEGKNLFLEEYIVEESVYTGIIQFIKSVAQAKIKINKVTLKQDGIIELQTQEGVLIRASVFDDYKKNFTNFIALFEQNILILEDLNSVEYIDLRFGNKVFYKNKTN